MKKLFGILLIALLYCAINAPEIKAVTLNIGGNCYYNWWTPAWTKGKLLNEYTVGNIKEDVKNFPADSTFMYGPLISIKFNRVGIGFNFIHSTFEFKTKGPEQVISYQYIPQINPGIYIGYGTVSRKVTHWSLDNTYSYTINKYLKIFTGIKIKRFIIKDK